MCENKVLHIPIVCAECGQFLGAYMGASPEPVVRGVVFRFCPMETRNTTCVRDDEGLMLGEERRLPLLERPTYF